MKNKFNRYVRKDQVVIDKKKYETVCKHSNKLGFVAGMIKNGATLEEIKKHIEKN